MGEMRQGTALQRREGQKEEEEDGGEEMNSGEERRGEEVKRCVIWQMKDRMEEDMLRGNYGGGRRC